MFFLLLRSLNECQAFFHLNATTGANPNTYFEKCLPCSRKKTMQFIVLRSKNTTLFFIEIAEHMHSMLISWMSHEKM